MADEYKWVGVFLFILVVFIPVTWQAIQRRRLDPPPMAKNDRKLYRLWRSDPKAYARQYGEMDRSYLAAQEKKNAKKSPSE